MGETLKNFIGGEWVDSTSGKVADNTNPAHLDQVICKYPLSTRDEMKQAIESAHAAHLEWKKVPAPVRGEVLFKAANLFEERADEIAKAMTLEEGKLLREAKGEVGKTVRFMRFCAGEARRLNGETTFSEMASTMAYTTRMPLGVVGLITPWNFPVAIPAWKIAPAIISGCGIVLKPAEQTPLTAKLVVEVFNDAGCPAGLLNLVFGLGEDVGDELVKHDKVAGISFTGSTETGLMIYGRAAALGKKVQCEMGGKNPLVLLEDGDIDMALNAAAFGGFGSTGQRCTATSRCIVHESHYDAFVERLSAIAKETLPGDGLDETSGYGPSCDQQQFDTVLKYLAIAKEEGARITAGGGRATGEGLDNGLFVQATVLADVTPDMRVAKEEIFGPVISVLKVSSLEEAMTVANDVAYGLSSSVYTKDVNQVFRFIDQIETGIVHINSPTVGGEAHLPFGGIKATGVGEREMGNTAIDFFTETKTVYVDYTGGSRGGNLY